MEACLGQLRHTLGKETSYGWTYYSINAGSGERQTILTMLRQHGRLLKRNLAKVLERCTIPGAQAPLMDESSRSAEKGVQNTKWKGMWRFILFGGLCGHPVHTDRGDQG